jgi:Lrp/AsnC family transcriptional regulator, leucine-responsive regulatory protein
MAPILGILATIFRVIFAIMPKKTDLDSFDRRLIEEARRDNLQPARVLADKVGLSVSAVLRRLRRLREERVIIADRAVIDPALTGSALTMHVLVKMRQAGARSMDAFSRSIVHYPEVTGAWDVTGDDDFVLKVQVGSMQEYDRFTRRALGEAQGVYAFKTLITIRTIVDDDGSRRPILE